MLKLLLEICQGNIDDDDHDDHDFDDDDVMMMMDHLTCMIINVFDERKCSL